MKSSLKVVLPCLCALLLFLSTNGSSHAELFVGAGEAMLAPFSVSTNARQEASKEATFYYSGGKWIGGWFQCDAGKEVAIFDARGKTLRYEGFTKRLPLQKTVLTLPQAQEPDCGMMKCYFKFAAQDKTIIVRESHYRDDDFWTAQYVMAIKIKGRNPDEQDCRWFQRTRLAVITDRRSIYVTKSEAGDLEYRSYNYGQNSNEPSVMLKGGRRAFNESNKTESFTFKSREYAYVLSVSTMENRPLVEVLIKKNGTLAQKESCLSYTYLKKS